MKQFDLFGSDEDIFLKESEDFLKKMEAKIEELEKESFQEENEIFEWDKEFPQLCDENGNFEGFDIVMGNPPYIDSESMVKKNKIIREHIKKNYKLTKGNWDIYIGFFELAFNLLSENGFLSFITPDKWLSKSFGLELRKTYLPNLTNLSRAGRTVFKEAKVDSIVTIFNKTKKTNYFQYFDYQGDKFIKINDISKKIFYHPFQLDIIFSKNLKLILSITKKYETITKVYNIFCENACSTSDAYKLKEIIFDFKNQKIDEENYFKVINTGTIDKYVSKWGKKKMTYLGDKYLFPVVKKSEFFEKFKNSYSQKTKKTKIIIKGLTLLDASLDLTGNFIAGKSTLMMQSKNKSLLKFLSSIINSKLSIFYIKERYSASTYNTGINFTKYMINNFPIPKISDNEMKNFEILTDNIFLKKNKENTDNLENKLNFMIYKLYNLTKKEIKIIENENFK